MGKHLHRGMLVAILACPVALASTAAAPTVSAAPGLAAAYAPVKPCRLLDTRESNVKVEGNRSVTVPTIGRCGISGAITAVALTITAVAPEGIGFVTAWPSGTPMPLASTLNFTGQQVISNGAIIPVSAAGAFEVMPSIRSHLVVDVTGVFAPANMASAGRYVALSPTRLLDTRTSRRLVAGDIARVPLPPTVPADATAVSVTITAIATNGADFLTAYPSGDSRPLASVVNTDTVNQTRATGQIVPVNGRGFDVYTKAGSDVIVDIGGWFTGPSAPVSDQGLFVSATPTRLIDTRPISSQIHKAGTLVVDPTTVSGQPIAAVVANWTSTQTRAAGFVAAYPAQTPRPTVSTVNTDRRAQTMASLGIIPVSTKGVAVFANAGSHLIVDVTGWFTGQPVAATGPAERNDPVTYAPLRVLLMGDSSMAGVRWYTGSHQALGGNVEYVLDMESCRRLIRSSCRGREGRVPPNAVNAIAAQPGTFDIVVVQTGYNDQYTYFEDAFDQTVAAARAKGATQIIWLTYREGAVYVNAQFDPAAGHGFAVQNAQLRAMVATGLYPDVTIADWWGYTKGASKWFTSDGVHFTVAGAYGAADYIARHIAALNIEPCPAPWRMGETIEKPCSHPDRFGVLPDVLQIYAGNPNEVHCYEVGEDRHLECRRDSHLPPPVETPAH